MPTNVIIPVLELAQETGKVLRCLKAPRSLRQGRSDRRDREGDGSAAP